MTLEDGENQGQKRKDEENYQDFYHMPNYNENILKVNASAFLKGIDSYC